MCAELKLLSDSRLRLLLAHCADVGERERPSPRSRLETALGGDLAEKLLFALAPDQAGRVGSSSP